MGWTVQCVVTDSGNLWALDWLWDWARNVPTAVEINTVFLLPTDRQGNSVARGGRGVTRGDFRGIVGQVKGKKQHWR